MLHTLCRSNFGIQVEQRSENIDEIRLIDELLSCLNFISIICSRCSILTQSAKVELDKIIKPIS